MVGKPTPILTVWQHIGGGGIVAEALRHTSRKAVGLFYPSVTPSVTYDSLWPSELCCSISMGALIKLRDDPLWVVQMLSDLLG